LSAALIENELNRGWAFFITRGSQVHTLFEYSGRYAPEVLNSYGAVTQSEFYTGELDPIAADSIDLGLEKSLEYPITLLKLFAKTSIGFRRAWHHIRQDKVGVRVIWFVARGSVEIARPDGMLTANAGESIIVDSNVPFQMRTKLDAQSIHQSFQVIVPAHLFISHLPDAIDYRGAYTTETGLGQSVIKLLGYLFTDGEKLGQNATEPLVSGFLRMIGDTIDQDPARSRPLTSLDRRLWEIEAYVMKHLTDPDLSFHKVASSCGISARYLSYVLKNGDTTFSDLLWGRRIVKAKEWLTSSSMRNHMVQEIAFMAGFKSAAHFSRMFKDAYGCSPKEFRMTQLVGATDEAPLEIGTLLGFNRRTDRLRPH
jgi:AraC family transcriptional regulator, positive regulator of tynA and feaB